MNAPQPFTPGFTALCREMQADALERLGLIPTVAPVCVAVSEGNPALVARLLDPRPIGGAEWAEIDAAEHLFDLDAGGL